MFTSQLLQLIALICLLISAVWAGVWWWTDFRLREREAPDSAPVTLWGCLCRAHDISPADAARLVALGQKSGLADACVMFVDPGFLEHAASSANSDAAEFARLGRLVFGEVFQEAQG